MRRYCFQGDYLCLSFVPVVVLSSIAYVATLMCLVKRSHLIQNISCVRVTALL